MFGSTEKIEKFILTPEGNIEVVKRQSSSAMYASNPPRPVPDHVWKEIYGVVDGKIKLIEKKEGKHIPASFNEEKITFD